jgi:membrane protein
VERPLGAAAGRPVILDKDAEQPIASRTSTQIHPDQSHLRSSAFIGGQIPSATYQAVRLTPGAILWLCRRSLVAAFDDGCFGVAKAAAYSALLSFFPVLASAATILVQTRADFVSRLFQNALQEIVPPGTEDLVVQQFRVAGERPIAVLIGAGIVSIWAASGVIKSLIEGFQAAYRVPRNRGFVHQSILAMGLVLASALPLLGASLLIVFGGQVERLVSQWMHVDPEVTALAWKVARYSLAFLTTVAVSAILYYFGPYRKQRWRYVLPGAVIATVFWLLATMGFAWYTRHLAHYNVLYGSVSAGIALLVWMYLLAAIAMIGCEFNAEYERNAR